MTNSGEATVINDRYEIHKRIGRGGMADVFLARDLLLDRQVAVKVLFPEFAIDPNFVERFRREAQAAANLSHPNIVNVYDWGKYSGTYFITMEYVQGRTLAEILRTNRQLTAKQGAEIASEVAAALGFAHEAGLAHRDIKPANILIGSNGQVKVADFGIARAMNAPTESNLTQAGAVMGTASYFSPEQAQGAQPDPRSDLYSLGIVMYEMVAGRPPFTGENPVSIAYKQVHDPPQPLNQIVADIPRPFEAIIAKLLAKDPKLRYPSAHALRDDLRRFRNGEQVQALVSAVAGSQARTTTTMAAAPTTVTTASSPTRTVSPSGMPMATSAMPPTTVQSNMAGYPPGASPAARYYEDGHSRTGWYALAAFVALIALVAGGVLLFQALNKDDSETVGITLEDYTNQRLDAVTAALRALDLSYAVFPEENAVVAEDFVHRTDPPAGTLVTPGTVIKLYYRPTPDLVLIPNVAGRTLQDARDILGSEGFEVVEESEENELDVGLVIRTEPAGGERVRQDTTIKIVVSGGPQQIAIPASVIGDSVDVATQLLSSEQYGFDVVTESQQDAEIPAGTVIATRPETGTLVARGSTVTLIVSSGPGPVNVPPVIGLTEAVARNSLASTDLQASVEYRSLQPGDANDGLVISQSIPSGTSVERGTVVALVVGQATAPVTTTSTTTTTTLPPETTVPVTVTTVAPP
ncbi:MAG TPA: Stk1 family PASTA domain-containing Ser/Thr kinase [Ilumatobacteraceae bacterium]|nr:Stk1 family PASTA domain-containing Ser/Thr kinase [Ilumatobacteraceae bacterium]